MHSVWRASILALVTLAAAVPLLDLGGSGSFLAVAGIVGLALGVIWRRAPAAPSAPLEPAEPRPAPVRGLEAIFREAPVGLAALDREGHFVVANQRLVELLGRTEAELSQLRLADVVAEEDRALTAAQLAAVLDGKAAEKAGVNVERPDGQRTWVGVAMTVPAGAAEPVVAVIEDLSQARRCDAERQALLEREQETRRQAEQASRIKDEFLTTLSHELRTPLNAISGWTYVLGGSEVDGATYRRAVESIQRNVKAQTQLLNNILDVSRIISGKLRVSLHPVRVDSVVQSALEVISPAARAKGVHTRVALESDLEVMADADRLQQMLWNLLSNAVRFTPAGGSVSVASRASGDKIEIRVADSGTGIAPDFLPHVFDRFRQADASIARPHDGLGLGLAIVRHLVELHGGSVGVESAGPGLGACFTLTLPSIRPRLPWQGGQPLVTETRSNLAFRRSDLQDMRVLIVDDEAESRDIVAEILRLRGAEPITAASAAEGLRLFQASRPDLLLLDIAMPEETGYDLIRRIRALGTAQGGDTPAVALTAHVSAEDREFAAHAGFQMHIAKPFDPAELINAVLALGKRRRSVVES